MSFLGVVVVEGQAHFSGTPCTTIEAEGGRVRKKFAYIKIVCVRKEEEEEE